jgi:hypothetical protein
MTNLIAKRPTRKINKNREINQMAYFSQNGQTGNRTKDKMPIIKPIIIVFFDYVVSNRNDANFFYFYGAVGKIGYNKFGYLA